MAKLPFCTRYWLWTTIEIIYFGRTTPSCAITHYFSYIAHVRRYRCVWCDQPHTRKGCSAVELPPGVENAKSKQRVCKSCKPALRQDKAAGHKVGGHPGGNDNQSFGRVVGTNNADLGKADSTSKDVVSKKPAKKACAVVRPLGVASSAAYVDSRYCCKRSDGGLVSSFGVPHVCCQFHNIKSILFSGIIDSARTRTSDDMSGAPSLDYGGIYLQQRQHKYCLARSRAQSFARRIN